MGSDQNTAVGAMVTGLEHHGRQRVFTILMCMMECQVRLRFCHDHLSNEQKMAEVWEHNARLLIHDSILVCGVRRLVEHLIRPSSLWTERICVANMIWIVNYQHMPNKGWLVGVRIKYCPILHAVKKVLFEMTKILESKYGMSYIHGSVASKIHVLSRCPVRCEPWRRSIMLYCYGCMQYHVVFLYISNCIGCGSRSFVPAH